MDVYKVSRGCPVTTGQNRIRAAGLAELGGMWRNMADCRGERRVWSSACVAESSGSTSQGPKTSASVDILAPAQLH